MSDNPDISEVREQFKAIDPHEKEGKRSPHRPLLVLYALGKLEEGQRRLSFEQVDRDFDDLFEEFGPPHDTSVKYPFWYLREDGVWEVEEADDLPRRTGGKEPLVSALRNRNTRGWFSAGVWTVLQENPQLRREVAQMMLDKCFPETLHQEILNAVGLGPQMTYYSSMQRKRDPDFRDNVLDAYNRRCAVCGFDVLLNEKSVGLEAAHIKWRQYDGPDVVSNGLALCSLHHKMLDKGVIHVGTNLRLVVAENVHGSAPHINRLRERHGREIHTPQRNEYAPQEDYVDWHVREVFRDEYSAG